MLEWVTQDVKCKKCKRLRANEFMEHCACSGEWGGTRGREEVRKMLGVYGGVAGYFGLGMVGGVVGECLEGF